MRAFFREALETKLRASRSGGSQRPEPPWLKLAGVVPNGAREEIDAIVDEEFSAVDPGEWQ